MSKLGPPVSHVFRLVCPYCGAEVEVRADAAIVFWTHDGCRVDPDGEIVTSLPTDQGKLLPPREVT